MSIEMLTGFLMWCTIINLGLMLLTMVLLGFGRDMAFAIHHKIFGINREQFDLAIFYFLAFWKLLVFVFFAIPWIALLIIG